MTVDGDLRFVQGNADPGGVYAIVDGRPALAFGPLAPDQIYRRLYRSPPVTVEATRLAAALAERTGEFHPLDDYFAHIGADEDLRAWIASTPLTDPQSNNGLTWYRGGGRSEAEVARRLGIGAERLRVAALREAVFPGAFRIDGEPMVVPGFEANWAVVDASWRISINPNAYRFKAWYATIRSAPDELAGLPTWREALPVPATLATVTAAIAAARAADRNALRFLVDWPLTGAALIDHWRPGGPELHPQIAQAVVDGLGVRLVRAQGIEQGDANAIGVMMRTVGVPAPSDGLTEAQRDRLAELSARASAGLDVYIVTDDHGNGMGLVVAADSGLLVATLPDWARQTAS